jgi:hypothetical protein
MASPTEQTIKPEPSLPSSSSSEQSTTTTTTTTIKQEFSVTEIQEDETFEQFYSEVIRSSYE